MLVHRSVHSNTIATYSFEDQSVVHWLILQIITSYPFVQNSSSILTNTILENGYWKLRITNRKQCYPSMEKGENTLGDGYEVNQSRNSELVFSAEKSSQIFSNVCIQLNQATHFNIQTFPYRSYLTAKWQFCRHTHPPSLCAR